MVHKYSVKPRYIAGKNDGIILLHKVRKFTAFFVYSLCEFIPKER